MLVDVSAALRWLGHAVHTGEQGDDRPGEYPGSITASASDDDAPHATQKQPGETASDDDLKNMPIFTARGSGAATPHRTILADQVD